MRAPTTFQPWVPEAPPPPPPPLPPSKRRSRGRGRHRRPRRRPPTWLLLVLLAVAAVGAGMWFLMIKHEDGSAAPPPPASSEPAPVYHGPLHLTVIAVRTEPQPFVAVVGSMGERPPVALDVPSHLVLTLPSGTVADAAQDDPTLLEASISNMLGAWTEHAVVLSKSGLSGIVDEMGGAPVRLEDVLTLDGENVGPGVVTLSGAQVTEYLTTGSSFDQPGRWRAVVAGLLSGGPTIENGDGVEADDAAAVTTALDAATGARILALPTRASGGGLLVPVDDRIRNVLATSFGIASPPPVDVVVLNGSGVPGVAGTIAAKLVPEGFRIAAAQNAPSFDHKETVVYASSRGALGAAQEAARLLGVSRVTLGGAASGVADITILVGRDFKSV
jgi:hypothetical protein